MKYLDNIALMVDGFPLQVEYRGDSFNKTSMLGILRIDDNMFDYKKRFQFVNYA